MDNDNELTRNVCGLRIASTIRHLKELKADLEGYSLDANNWDDIVTAIDKMQDAVDEVEVESFEIKPCSD